MKLLAEHHVERIRYSRKGREIVALKHVAFGWISPRKYVMVEELRRSGPDLLKTLFEAAYQVKSTILGFSFAIGPITIPSPVLATFVSDLYNDYRTGRGHNFLKHLIFMVAPFGEIVYLARWAEFVARGGSDALQGSLFLDHILDPILVPIARTLGLPMQNAPDLAGGGSGANPWLIPLQDFFHLFGL